jgi:hypothetical protein
MNDLSEDAVIERLQLAAAQGTTIRSWCQHDGFKLFKKHFEDKIDQARETWLTEEDPAKQASLKRKALLWTEVVTELKKFMLVGDNALRVLQENNLVNEASEKPNTPQ